MPTQTFDYKRYLASREWAVRREAVRLRAAGGVPQWAADALCERCCSHPLRATHHLTYERIGREELDDLLGVCNGCHAYLSGKSEDDPVDEAIAAMAKDLLGAATMLASAAAQKDLDWNTATGCLGMSGQAGGEIEKLFFRRAAIAAGWPASRFLR